MRLSTCSSRANRRSTSFPRQWRILRPPTRAPCATASGTDKLVPMFSVSVRSHVMIAHSFRGELFGPAQKLHGATYVVDVEFRRPELGPEGVVVDIARAAIALEEVLGELNYKNLDDDPSLAGKNT